jgi:hypothetical protein
LTDEARFSKIEGAIQARLMAFGADERGLLAASVPRLDALSG